MLFGWESIFLGRPKSSWGDRELGRGRADGSVGGGSLSAGGRSMG